MFVPLLFIFAGELQPAAAWFGSQTFDAMPHFRFLTTRSTTTPLCPAIEHFSYV
jgi:hypothetical protein